MIVTLRTREEIEQARRIEAQTLKVWDASFNATMELLKAHNAFYREKQRGMGAGKYDSGEGIVEARMPIQLAALAFAGDPDFLEDDKKFYAFLNKHKEFRAYDYNKRMVV